MNNRVIRPVLAASLAWCCLELAQPEPLLAQSQGYQPPRPRQPYNFPRPTTSPYLNLLNSAGGEPALNYYNFVRPQQQERRAANEFAREIGSLQTDVKGLSSVKSPDAAVAPITSGRMAPTGHAAAFGNTAGYFPSTGGAGVRPRLGPR